MGTIGISRLKKIFKMNSCFIVILAVALATYATADKVPDFVIKGKCPAIDEVTLWQQQKPNHSKFGGLWYQYALTNNPYQLIDRCARNQYTFNGKATGINAEGQMMKRTGDLSPMPLGDPHLMIALENSFPAPLVILESDYSSYACLYSCMAYNFDYYSDFSFIFTRSPNPSAADVNKCEKVFKDIGLDTSRFQKTIQGADCPYNTLDTL